MFDAVVRGGGGAFDEAHRCACGRIGFEEELDADVEVEDPYPMFVLLVAVVCNVDDRGMAAGAVVLCCFTNGYPLLVDG